MNIWSSISSKKFFQNILDLLRKEDIPEVQIKLLGLIQKWGLNFEDKKNVLPNFYIVYKKLLNSNVQFPNDFESNYQKYISNNSKLNYYKSNNNNCDKRNDDYENDNNNKEDGGETFYYMDSLKNNLKVPNFEHKYRRLVNFLTKIHENIQKANLLIDSGERAGLKDIINTLRDGNNTLIDTISGGRLKDDKLLEITMGTTEDINQALNRYEDLLNGYKPKNFTSYFVLNNVIPIESSNNNYRSRSKSEKPKNIQRRDERYKNYDMDLNSYDKNKYKEKMKDLFFSTNSSSEPGYNNNNNQSINSFFSSQNQIRENNNIFSNNNRNILMGNNNNNNYNFQEKYNMNNNNNNNLGSQFNQNNNNIIIIKKRNNIEKKESIKQIDNREKINIIDNKEKNKIIDNNEKSKIIIENKEDINYSFLLEKNKEYENKINELENIIKELNIKLIQKDKLLKEEKTKNDNLNEKI